MAGIYIHIPFCKQACHYCDFHFSTSLKNKPELVRALIGELELRRGYLPENEPIQTIYFGGGTPSLLTASELNSLFEAIYKNYKIADNPEITLEANPDDLKLQHLKEIRQSPVNRLSIGIQSFFEEDLKWMNRAHNATEAKNVLKDAVSAGFEDLTADLIFGFPLLTDEKWATNIQSMLDFGIKHLSAYAMTVEKGTPLAAFIRKGQTPPMDEAQAARQFLYLMDKMSDEGWEQYEISNYAKDGHYSRHNTSYWQGVPYLGIGPSAHSFDGTSRQWNTRVNSRYMEGIKKGIVDFKREVLTVKNHFDEYVMTSLRTQWGLDLNLIEKEFGLSARNALINAAEPFLKNKELKLEQEKLTLTRAGKLFADGIAADLFL